MTTPTPTLHCRRVSVDYGPVRAVDQLDLVVGEAETVALLGPSGSGKSTLLYAVAGFVDIAGGSIEIDGGVVSTPGVSQPPERRPVGVVFQNYALWPHLTAAETVAYPLRRAGAGKHRAMTEARRLLDTVGIAELAQRKPAELSGGQQQRVGLARALARHARLYLFDEPTAHLDAPLRGAIQQEIALRRRETGAAAIYATHDAAEALAIADRVALLRDGAIVQVGTPRDAYDRPVDAWAARLTGNATVIPVDVVGGTGSTVEVIVGGSRVVAETLGGDLDGSAAMLVRPEWVRLGGPLRGTVAEVWFRGSHTDVRLETAVGKLDVRVAGAVAVSKGETIGCTVVRGWLLSGADEHRGGRG
jgi:ABC-type Fe3+/spermidine/putrescine transport system ATPase subunit